MQKAPGPMDASREQFIKLSGRNGVDDTFTQSLYETHMARIWETNESQQEAGKPADANENVPRIKLRTGIVGIERNFEERHKQTDENINLAFKDLKKLIESAKDMVNISKVISAKIRERQGDISDDETIRFKSYLMSLGIDDPVTRDDVTGTEIDYFQRLANQLCEMLLDPLSDVGGMMSLADVYCRINRARGLELLSPEDLLNACRQLRGPIKLRQFPSGAMVLQLESHDDEAVAEDTSNKVIYKNNGTHILAGQPSICIICFCLFFQVEEAKSLSVEELATALGISLLLAQERMLTAERFGKICRDDSIEGLRFYPNLFLKI